jgi:ABC-type multidrug transport system fused ATPase/permease subunit
LDEKEVVGEIELKNIVFRYPTKKDVTVAKNINLKIE